MTIDVETYRKSLVICIGIQFSWVLLSHPSILKDESRITNIVVMSKAKSYKI